MENSQEKLSNLLHQKLDNIDVNINSSNGFDALQIKLSLQKFFYFHPRHFNIYYAAVILSSILFNVVLGVQYFRNQNAVEKKLLVMEEKLSTQQLVYQQLLQNQVASRPITVRGAESLPNITTASKLSNNISNSSVASTQIKVANVPKTDTSVTDSAISNIAQHSVDKALKTPSKILYIVKQDTIIQYDSIPLLPRKTRTRKK